MADTAPPQTNPQGFHLASDATGLTLHIPPLPEPLVIAIWAFRLSALLFIALVLINAWTNREKTGPWITKRWRAITGFLQRNYLTLLIPLGFLAVGWAVAGYLWQVPMLIGQMLDLLKLALKSVEDADADTTTIENIRTLAYTFAALAGMLAILATIPFQLVRVWINERTAATQEANLTTGLINTAVEGLGAEKSVSRIGRTVTFTREGEPAHTAIEWQDEDPPEPPAEGWKRETRDEWKTFERTLPNIEVRVGAILTLDRISRTNPEEHIRVMDILCAYVRENAPAKDAKDHPYGPWPDYPETPTAEDLEKRRKQLDKRTKDLRIWIKSLPEPRTDIQTALTTLGSRDPERIAREEARHTRAGKTGYRLDLRETNLRKCDLSHLDLRNARLDRARMEGADLSSAQMEGASLSSAQMEGARLWEARMEGADLSEARMEGAVLGLARMEGADLSVARMEGAVLYKARMEGASLYNARMEGADLSEARMEGAVLGLARMEGANLRGARMQGAVLSEARLQSAKWASAHTASPAQFADFRGARDLTQAQLDQMIGNEMTLLPDTPAPDTNQPFSIPSCWIEPPAAFVEMMRRWSYDWDKDLGGYRCPPGEEPQRTGTPLPLDAPYPEGHPLAERTKAE